MTRHEERIEPTLERQAKGDLRMHHDPDGHFLSTSLIPDTTLAVLIEKGHLAEHLADYAHGFLELRHAFLSQSRTVTCGFGETRQTSDSGVAASRYLFVLKRLAAHHQAIVINATTPGWKPDPRIEVPTYRHAFERLAEVMNEARTEVTAKTIAQELAKIEAKGL